MNAWRRCLAAESMQEEATESACFLSCMQFFFKQMRRSLDRRASRSTSFGSYRNDDLSRRPSPTPDALGHMTPEEEASDCCPFC